MVIILILKSPYMINGWFVNNQDMHWFASDFTPNTVDVSHLDTSSLIGDPCYIQVHQFILNINKKFLLKANYQVLLPEFYNMSSTFSNGLKILFPLIYTIISDSIQSLNMRATHFNYHHSLLWIPFQVNWSC